MTSIKIKTSDLKNFLELAKFVKTESIDIPALKYIKFEIDFGICTLIKMNQKAFVKHSFSLNEQDCSFLVNEEKLSALVNISKKEHITIEIEEGKTTLKDGYYKQNFGLDTSVNEFPNLPETNRQYTRIDKEVLDALSSARVHIGKDILFPYFMYVYFDSEYIYATNSSAMYIKRFNKQLPRIAITFDECSLLSLFSYIDYSVTENYNIYSFNNTIYGFRQPEDATGFKFMDFVKKITKQNYIIIQKEDLINFCASCLAFVGSGFCNSTLTVYKSNAIIKYQDSSKTEENVIEVPVNIVGDDFQFGFNPSVFLPILKSLNYNDICLSNEQGVIGIWNKNDENYIGLISKMDAK